MANNSFAEKYPSLARWIDEIGWIEIGQFDGSDAFIWALDEGGVVWEGKGKYKTIDDAFRDADKGLSAWIEENLGD